MARHLMLVPAAECPARCTYCFGPWTAGACMEPRTLQEVVAGLPAYGGGEPVDITFHGGEPLSAGMTFFGDALPRLSRAAGRAPRLAIQSNLWMLTDDWCRLLAEHGVAIGTSLDGPEPINDRQRGPGHFRRTMRGIERARRFGFNVPCICTVTAESAARLDDVFDFFVREGLDFSLHAAVPRLVPAPTNGPGALPRAAVPAGDAAGATR